MATTLTEDTIEPVAFPWAGVNDIVGDRSAIPRGCIRFNGAGTIAAAATVADDQALYLHNFLPQNFAYVCTDMHMRIITLTNGLDNDWNEPGYVSMFGRDGFLGWDLITTATSANDQQSSRAAQMYHAENITSEVIIPPVGSNIDVFIAVAIQDLDKAAMTYNFHASYLQFDISQANNWAVNSPLYTRK